MTTLVVFEDHRWNRFLPLTTKDPVCELYCGVMSLRARLMRLLRGCGIGRCLIHSPRLGRIALPLDEDAVLVNGRLLAWGLAAGLLLRLARASWLALEMDGTLVAAKAPRSILASVEDPLELLRLLPRVRVFVPELLGDPADLMRAHPRLLRHDLSRLASSARARGSPTPGVVLLGDVELEPFVVMRPSGGPIIVCHGARIEAGARIEGPCFIGPRCRIRGRAIVSGSLLLADVDAGGYIEDSILMRRAFVGDGAMLCSAYVAAGASVGHTAILGGLCASEVGRVPQAARYVLVGPDASVEVGARVPHGSVWLRNADLRSAKV